MKDEAFQALLNAPSPLTLYASRKKHVFFFLLTLLGLAGGVAMTIYPGKANDVFSGWAVIVFCALGMALFGAMIFFPKTTSLTLGAKEFTIMNLGKKVSYRWEDVSAFLARPMLAPRWVKQADVTMNILDKPPALPLSSWGSSKYVFFDETSKGKMADLARLSTGGYSGMLPTSYAGMNAEQLAQLLNHWRERAIGANTR